jgi:hypothetical protein
VGFPICCDSICPQFDQPRALPTGFGSIGELRTFVALHFNRFWRTFGAGGIGRCLVAICQFTLALAIFGRLRKEQAGALSGKLLQVTEGVVREK